MAKCQVCAYENEDGAEYCEECGVKLASAAPPPATLSAAPSGGQQPEVELATLREERPPAAGACPSCGHAVPDGTRFCPKCGTRMDAFAAAAAAPAEGAKKCPSCGTEAEPNAVFCMSCGTRVGGGESPAKPKGEVIRLRMVAGKDKDKVFEIERSEIRIGRLAENDIPLESDGYVSGKHTRISKQGDEFFVEDLGSTNGTFLKVRKLTRLAPGDEIKVGQSIFRLE